MNIRMTQRFRVPVIWVGERYDQPMITVYDAVIGMTSVSEDLAEINIAYQRMKFWFYEIMKNSVVISDDFPSLDAWRATQTRCLVLPQEPVDQLMGIMLYRKMDAVVQGRLNITDVGISSTLDEEIIYHHDSDEDQGCLSQDGWWSDPRPTWSLDSPRHRRNSKVINLRRQAEWKDHDLDWDPDDSSGDDGVVVVTDFGRDEN